MTEHVSCHMFQWQWLVNIANTFAVHISNGSSSYFIHIYFTSIMYSLYSQVQKFAWKLLTLFFCVIWIIRSPNLFFSSFFSLNTLALSWVQADVLNHSEIGAHLTKLPWTWFDLPVEWNLPPMNENTKSVQEYVTEQAKY